MTALTPRPTARPVHAARTAFVGPESRLSFPRVVRSEWIKITSLRSTVWSLLMIVLSGVGLSLLLAATMESAGLPDGPSVGFTLTTVTLGVMFGQIVAAVLGVLAISGEYSTGMIRSTLTAVPTRLPVLAAKAVVLFVLVVAVGLVTLVGAWAATYPLFAAAGIATSLAEPGFFVAILGAATYLGLTAVFALGIGTLLRSAAGGVATVLGVILGLPLFLPLAALAFDWVADVGPFLFTSAGEAMAALPLDAPAGTAPVSGGPLEPWAAGLVVLAWTGVSLVLAGLSLRRRDA
ncbi:ABC transporter permease [Labedella populi]|uniref:ABC transporter permease n=1 Tax=Labedella populi TaxID=2498850 RepID=A0A3S4AFC2_9MICO|nr:ABC transporter permease subunit [Labedella populi]RWZ58498.1 ABC transporter permease [Labedella populi]